MSRAAMYLNYTTLFLLIAAALWIGVDVAGTFVSGRAAQIIQEAR